MGCSRTNLLNAALACSSREEMSGVIESAGVRITRRRAGEDTPGPLAGAGEDTPGPLAGAGEDTHRPLVGAGEDTHRPAKAGPGRAGEDTRGAR